MIMWKVLFFLLVHNLHNYNVNSCDQTFFLHSQNKICKDEICSSDKVSVLVMLSGQTSCFLENETNRVFKIKLNKISLIKSYKAIYYACNYEGISTYHYRCWDAGHCNNYGCTASSYDDYGHPIRPNNINTNLTYYTGCIKQGDCRGYCGYDTYDRCAWGRFDIREKECYPVVKLVDTTWEIDYIISDHNNLIYHYRVTERNPIFERTILGITYYNPPATLVTSTQTLVIIEKGIGIPIFVSPVNSPIPNTVGVYQKDLEGNNRVFPLSELINCRLVSCTMLCKLPKSPLTYIPDIVEWKERKSYITLKTVSPLESEYTSTQEIYSGTTLTFLQVKGLDTLIIKKSLCHFDVTHIISCFGCSTPTTVGIQPVNITVPGFMYLKSNCSVTPNYFKCQDDPFQISIISSSEYCMINTYNTLEKTGNITQSLIIKIDPEFTGTLVPIEYLTSIGTADNPESEPWALFKSSNFLTGLGIATGLLTLLPMLIRIVIALCVTDKITNYCMTLCNKKQ